MRWDVIYDKGFIEDLKDYHESDRSLGDEMVKRVKAIEQDPLKGELKMAHLADCRGDHVARRYAIIYQNTPNIIQPELVHKIEEVYFRGIKHHDNQADAVKNTARIEPMTSFSVTLPYETGPRVKSEFHDHDSIYVENTEWGNSVTIKGQFRNEARGDFEDTLPPDSSPDYQSISVEDFLPD